MPTSHSPSSGSTGKNGKFCTVCNDDVSAKPRTKDAKGRYFCTGCYEEAIRAKQEKREITPLPKVSGNASGPVAKSSRPAPKAPPIMRGMGDADDRYGEPNVLEQLLDLEPTIAAPTMICPSCHSQIPAGGVMCTMCGHNMQTGTAVGATHVKKAGPSGGVWPMVVGITSIVFGAGGAIVAALSLLNGLLGSAGSGGGWYSSGNVAGGLLPLGLSLWLTSAGVGIVRRHEPAVTQIKRWAMVKLVLYGSCLGITLVALPTMVKNNPNALPPALSVYASNLTLILTVMLVWVSAWPVFVLIWFSRASVKRDIEQWNQPVEIVD